MPTVPIEQNRVGIAGVTDAKLRAGDFSGTGLQAIGSGLQSLAQGGQQLAEAVQHRQDIYDDAAVRQADNELAEHTREITLTGDGAYYKKTGADAYGSSQATQEALAKAREKISAALKNDTQRRMFAAVSDRRLQSEYDGIAKHADVALIQYKEDQSKARMTLASDNAVTYADDPERFGEELQRVGAEVDAQTQGQSPEVNKMAHLAAVSSIRTRVVDQKMTADPVGAAAYVEDHRGEFLPGDLLKIGKALHDPLMERQGAADVDGLMGSDSGAYAAAPAPVAGGGTTAARMIAITAHAESGDRDRNRDGSIVTSPKGAQGRMQVMPGTNTDPGFGVTPARDGSDAERARVGRDYLAAMVKRYRGDPAKAWAAYNGGPGRVDDAIAAHGAGWLAAMPKETRDYVSTNVAALGGNSSAPTLAPRRDDLAGLYARIDDQPWDFERKQRARAEVDKRVARDDHLIARQEKDADDAAARVTGQLGDGFTSVSQIPADVRRNLSPKDLNQYRALAERNATPKPVQANGDTIIGLHQLANFDPDTFKTTNLGKFRGQMSPAEYDQIATLQSAMIAKPDSPAQLSHSQIWKFATFRGRDIGIDMSAQRKGEAADAFHARRADGFALFTVMENYLKALTEGKRQPTDDEVNRAYDNAVMPYRNADGAYVPRFRVSTLPTNSVATPTAWHNAMREKLKAQGLRHDDQTIAGIYLERQRNAR